MNLDAIFEKSESSTLDYKLDLYDFTQDKDFSVTAKFVKDIASFCNTIRSEDAYIIFGVNELENGEIQPKGITKSIDDAVLQDKIKDKLFPRPIFLYSTVKHNNLVFGVLKIPVKKYELPITPTIKLKGLEVGKVYYRNGTSNTEASGIDIIRINDWFRSLPGNVNSNMSDEVSEILKNLTRKEEKLSLILTQVLDLSKRYNLEDLQLFSTEQLKGTTGDATKYGYRVQNVLVSINEISINPYSMHKVTATLVKKELEKHEDFYDYKMLFNQPIVKIEEMISYFESNPNSSYATQKLDANLFFETKEKYKLNVYIFEDNIFNVYSNIRQKTIDELMKI